MTDLITSAVDLQFEFPREQNWDSYGAFPTTPEAIETIKSLFICPTKNGGAQIELHVHKTDLEVEIDSDGSISSVLWGKAL